MKYLTAHITIEKYMKCDILNKIWEQLERRSNIIVNNTLKYPDLYIVLRNNIVIIHTKIIPIHTDMPYVSEAPDITILTTKLIRALQHKLTKGIEYMNYIKVIKPNALFYEKSFNRVKEVLLASDKFIRHDVLLKVAIENIALSKDKNILVHYYFGDTKQFIESNFGITIK